LTNDQSIIVTVVSQRAHCETHIASFWNRPQRLGRWQNLGRFACQTVNFKTGESTILFKNKYAAKIVVSAEDKIR